MTSANPFHSWWWHAWRVATVPAVLCGFEPMLVRCAWTRSRCRVGLIFTAWGRL